MPVWKRIAQSNFVIRLSRWEYWPFGIIQLPVICYYLWLSLRSRSLVFFSASNPGIDMGGMFGESKFDVLKKIPPDVVPKTIRAPYPSTAEAVIAAMRLHGFQFPVIFKPDLGERGFMVRRISGPAEIEDYIKNIRIDFLVQDLVDQPCEFGVFYRRFPEDADGRVTSVVVKEMLSVTGDGRSTLRELILRRNRAKLQWPTLRQKFRTSLDEIIPDGKSIELVSIGNHALGTKFLDGSYLINDELSKAFDVISKQVDGFYYGRFDVRCNCPADLYKGKFLIMELNGCGAEPAHIYQPGFGLFNAYKVMFRHWRNIFEISRTNRSRGVRFVTLKEAREFYKKFKAATR